MKLYLLWLSFFLAACNAGKNSTNIELIQDMMGSTFFKGPGLGSQKGKQRLCLGSSQTYRSP